MNKVIEVIGVPKGEVIKSTGRSRESTKIRIFWVSIFPLVEFSQDMEKREEVDTGSDKKERRLRTGISQEER